MNLRLILPLVFGLVPGLASTSFAQTGVAPVPQTQAASAPGVQGVAQPLPDGKPHTFGVAAGQFVLDGMAFRVISGEMHYPRIPREYWRARLKMARAMGLNAITTYVFWNEHEQTPGTYDFSGNNDVAEFIRDAGQEGLWVILRPGPYVCAEWEFGGYPAWLLKDPATVIRSSDPKYMEPATRWILRLGQELAPLQVGKGGPILLVQVENEYGSFGNDHAYMEQNRQVLVDAGFTKAQLYTADGPGEIANGSLPDLPVGINFDGNHAGSAEKSFAKLKAARPDGVMFNSEFWAGWFDHWGGKHAHTSTETQAANLDWMLERGYSVSIYMFHGGTDFGWMNGANSNDIQKPYEPDVTSYDYDAALDESGRPTAKFFVFRDVIAKATRIAPPPVPEVAPPIHVAPFKLVESASLWDNLPKPIESDKPLTMEDIGQAYGWILYRTRLSEEPVDLTFHDYARAYLDGEPIKLFCATFRADGSLSPIPSIYACDRRLGNGAYTVHANAGAKEKQFDLLVENSGHINYSHQLLTDRKGVIHSDPPAQPLKWSIYSLPMTNPGAMHFKKADCSGPCFYRGTFDVDRIGDTFLDTSNLGKGQLWVNGHAMGRFWNVGPQKTLYVPGPWLKKGSNEVIVFDVDGKLAPTLEGLTKPNLGE